MQLLLRSSSRRLWFVTRSEARLLQPLLATSQSPSLSRQQGTGQDQRIRHRGSQRVVAGVSTEP